MERIPLSLDLVNEIDLEIGEIPLYPLEDGSGAPHRAASESGWIYGMSNTRLYRTGQNPINALEAFPRLRHALLILHTHNLGQKRNGELRQVMINRMEPGGRVEPHRDEGPDYYRYHLPILTDPLVTWWDEIEGSRHMECGSWYGPVPYRGVLHSVANESSVGRVHVIADYSKERCS